METERDKKSLKKLNIQAEYSSNHESTSVSCPSKAAFIVYWSSLAVLLNKCLTCCLPASVTNIIFQGSQLIVQLMCLDKHKTTLKSQPSVQRYSKGNLSLTAAVLCSANTFQKISKYLAIANIQCITKTNYCSIQDKFRARVVNKNYSKINASITHRLIDEGPRKLSGGGKCDSPGYSAKCFTYLLMNQETNEIIAFSILM